MKIIVTGSLGNVSRPLAATLVQKGHTVTVISSKPEKRKDIEALGAAAAIGTVEDVDFLTATFAGADAVYCMMPPNYAEADLVVFYQKVGRNYAQAIGQAGVKRVVHLSSMGADLDKGTGFILGSHHVEGMLNALPDVNVTHMRATYFYYNLNAYIDMIKAQGLMVSNYGGEDKLVLVSPIDIAAAVADEIVTPLIGRKVRYVASDVLTAGEVAGILGAAIGKPDLKWITCTDEQLYSALQANGMPALHATRLVELGAAIHDGRLLQDYYLNKPAMGNVKTADFAKDFAAAFNQK